VLIGARRGSPLILGIVSDGAEGSSASGTDAAGGSKVAGAGAGGHEYILASDATAILEYTKRVVYLKEGELVRATRDGMELFSLDVDEEGHIHHAGTESASGTEDGESGMGSFGRGEEVAEAGAAKGGGGVAIEGREGTGAKSASSGTGTGTGVVSRMSSSLKPGNSPSKARQRSLKGLSRRIPEIHRLEMDLQKIERGGHKHFMLKEIFEQPEVLRNCMRGRVDPEAGSIRIGAMSERLAVVGAKGAAAQGGGRRRGRVDDAVVDDSAAPTVLERFMAARRLIVVACGTSFHSGLVGEYLIESLARINVEVEYASEFRYRKPLLDENDVVIAVS